jgi:8-oxo-dGTP pyrophosphatase MutT (NUDIX family)
MASVISSKEMSDSAPTTFKAATTLSEFEVSMSMYLESRAGFDGVAAESLVFHGNRLLLVQRSAHDSMPSLWECPGGACDAEDESILHAAAREVWEETGLHVKRFNRQVGTGNEFMNRRGMRIFKVAFEVQVEEVDTAEATGLETVAVKLDPNEHQNWIWVSEEDCIAGKSGNVKIPFTNINQQRRILLGFEERRQGAKARQS